MSEKNNRPPLAVGTPSTLMIFVVLLLTCFGILAFSSARADSVLSQRTAQSVEEYYQADAQAQRALMLADGALEQASGQGAEQVLQTLNAALSGMARVTLEGEGFRMEFHYGQYQALEVVFKPATGGYELVSYRNIVINEPVYGEEPFHLWEGDD